MCRLSILVSILLVQFGLASGNFMVNWTAIIEEFHNLTTEGAPFLTKPEASFTPADSPRFMTENSSVVTAQSGTTVHLYCVIKNLDKYIVTWARGKNYHLISVGHYVFLNDQRYRVAYNERNEDWTLQIKFVNQRDAGLYMCQVSYDPPISIFIELKVTAMRGEFHDFTTEVAPSLTKPEASFTPADSPRFLTENSSVVTAQTGTTAYLYCVIKNLDTYIVNWVREKNYHLISVGHNIYLSDQRYRVAYDENNEEWTLQIKFVNQRDAGLYMCQVLYDPPISIFIELKVTDENPLSNMGAGKQWLLCPSLPFLTGLFVLLQL